ncbi:arylsulfatase I-like [Neosynchiropus ocellatus]
MRAVQATLTLVLFTLGSSWSAVDQNQGNHATHSTRKNQPHIIFILIDDQGFNDIGYHNPTIKSPTLDKLAAEGVKLENYYVQPICTPSRSQLLTGRYQIHTGLQHSIIRPSQPSCLPGHMDTLPERLREAGYATHMVGKWHLGFYRKACLPTRKGFDSFFGSLTGSVDYYSYVSCDGPGKCGYDLHDDEGVARGHEGKYSTAHFTQRARKILESHDPTERPLFLLLSLQAVHTPLHPPKSYIYPYRDMDNVARRKFAAMVSTVDESVRNLTYALRKYGYYRNSVIVYSTDNGAQPFTGGSNWPLRGRKGTYWEGGIRGVGFVHSPLLKRRRRVSNALLHITDWFPTLVGLAGGNISKSSGLDGFDVWSTISEGKASPRHEILHNIDPLHNRSAPRTTWDASADGPPLGGPKPAVRRTKSPVKKPKKKKKMKLLKQKSGFRTNGSKKSKAFLHLGSKPKVKPNTRRTKFHNQTLTRSAPQKSKHQLRRHLRARSKRMSPQLQNTSLSENHLLPTSESYQALWDTTVQAAIRVGDWKLLTGDPGHGEWVPLQVLPTLLGRWWNLERATFQKSSASKSVWLFNITADPYERQDLADLRPDVVRQLLARLAHYNRTAVPVFFPPDDPRADPSNHGGAWVPWADDDGDGDPSDHGGALVPWADDHDDDGGEERARHRGVDRKAKNVKKKNKKKCRLCKLKTFFLNLNTRIMSNRI